MHKIRAVPLKHINSLGDVRINKFYCWWYFHLIPFYRLNSVLMVVPFFCFETHALFLFASLAETVGDDACFKGIFLLFTPLNGL